MLLEHTITLARFICAVPPQRPQPTYNLAKPSVLIISFLSYFPYFIPKDNLKFSITNI